MGFFGSFSMGIFNSFLLPFLIVYFFTGISSSSSDSSDFIFTFFGGYFGGAYPLCNFAFSAKSSIVSCWNVKNVTALLLLGFAFCFFTSTSSTTYLQLIAKSYILSFTGRSVSPPSLYTTFPFFCSFCSN